MTIFVEGLNFKRKTTYISDENILIMCTIEALITREHTWDWAN